MTATLIQINVLCLAVGSVLWSLLDLRREAGLPVARCCGRPVVFAHLAAGLAVGLLGMTVAVNVARALLSLPTVEIQLLDWIALVATAVAVAVCLWDRRARFPLAGLYGLGLVAISMAQIKRGYSPGDFFLWGAICEWAAFVMIAGLIGWSLRRYPFASTRLRIPGDSDRWSGGWFRQTQAVLAAVTAGVATWISIDFFFATMGQDVALFGLAGRMAACPAALMLVGASILMAWQTTGAWRAGWQYAAMAAGVLFTSSIGWGRIDLASETPWMNRSENLMISAAMMTLLTRFGLARVLPNSGDWIPRARQAAPIFATLAILMLGVVLIYRALTFGDFAGR